MRRQITYSRIKAVRARLTSTTRPGVYDSLTPEQAALFRSLSNAQLDFLCDNAGHIGAVPGLSPLQILALGIAHFDPPGESGRLVRLNSAERAAVLALPVHPDNAEKLQPAQE